jgi:choline dehydrogenase
VLLLEAGGRDWNPLLRVLLITGMLLRDRLRRLRAEREVALCAGTIGLPMALLRSGIGDAESLRALGIPVVADRKEVGRNPQDHLLVRVEHACTRPVTLHAITRADRAALALQLQQALLFGTGPAASFPIAVGAFFHSHPARDIPDLRSTFLPGLSSAALRLPFLPRVAATAGHGVLAHVYRMCPESRGTLSLPSADPRDLPLIRPNHLSVRRDLTVLREGVKRIREVFAQAAFHPYRRPELAPGRRCGATPRSRPTSAARRKAPNTAPPPAAWARTRSRWWMRGCACAGSRGCASPTPR